MLCRVKAKNRKECIQKYLKTIFINKRYNQELDKKQNIILYDLIKFIK